MRKNILSALVFIALLVGWNQVLPAAKTGAKQAQNLHLSDAQIEGLIHTKLAKSKMAKEGFTVHVHNHVATWEGKTDVIQHKGAATRMAKTAGATSVENHIKIGEEAKRKSAEKLAMARNGGGPIKKASLVK